jgi:predicted nucleic acid-binding protein
LAVNGEASVIITEDEDLLSLRPFRGPDILASAVYLERPELPVINK